MPNCWTPIDRSTRANEPYAITGRAKSATLRNLQVASTPRGNTVGPTKMFNLLCFFVVERLARKKRGCEIFVTILSIFLSFFFSRMDYKFLSSHPFPDARSPLWNSSRFSELIYLPAGFRLLYVSRLYANRDSIVMYQLIEIPVHIIRTRAAVNSDRWGNNSERVLPWFHFESWFEGN